MVRDLINTPASDMLPEQLADAAMALAQEFAATLRRYRWRCAAGEQLSDHSRSRTCQHQRAAFDRSERGATITPHASR